MSGALILVGFAVESENDKDIFAHSLDDENMTGIFRWAGPDAPAIVQVLEEARQRRRLIYFYLDLGFLGVGWVGPKVYPSNDSI